MLSLLLIDIRYQVPAFPPYAQYQTLGSGRFCQPVDNGNEVLFQLAGGYRILFKLNFNETSRSSDTPSRWITDTSHFSMDRVYAF